jgi:hypothetical protein
METARQEFTKSRKATYALDLKMQESMNQGVESGKDLRSKFKVQQVADDPEGRSSRRPFRPNISSANVPDSHSVRYKSSENEGIVFKGTTIFKEPLK